MATITLDATTMTITTVCTAQEFPIVQAAIAITGLGPLQAMFAQFLQSALTQQTEQQRAVIQQKLPTLTPQQLAQISTIVGP